VSGKSERGGKMICWRGKKRERQNIKNQKELEEFYKPV